MNIDLLSNFVTRVVDYGMAPGAETPIVESAGIIASSLLNKNYLDKSFLDSLRVGNANCARQSDNQITMMAWAAKSLIIKGDQEGYAICKFFMDQLVTPFGRFYSNCFSLIVQEHELKYLTKESFCAQKLLYRQKLYNLCIPHLMEQFRKLEDDSGKLKENILVAMSSILKSDKSINRMIDFQQVSLFNGS